MILQRDKSSNRIFAFLLLVIILSVTGCKRNSTVRNGEQEELSPALNAGEVLVDHVRTGEEIYALVSTEGLTGYGDLFLVLSKENGEWIRSYENDFRELKPWKLDTADIDGDSAMEILVAVRKTTRYDKEEKNRMFIFNYEKDVLVKKWTGSQIAGTWRDFYAGDLVSAPGTELIFLEQLGDGLERIKVYSWFDFGFFLLAESDGYPPVKELEVQEENRLMIILQDDHELNLIMRDGKLAEAE